MTEMKRYLTGFLCPSAAMGLPCGCADGVTEREAVLFEQRTGGLDRRDFCLVDHSEGETEEEALECAYACCGAGPSSAELLEMFPSVEIICEMVDLRSGLPKNLKVTESRYLDDGDGMEMSIFDVYEDGVLLFDATVVRGPRRTLFVDLFERLGADISACGKDE